MGSGNRECRECGLWATAQTICMAAHSPDAPLFAVIGEAPGEHEDEAGEPFVGAAGQLLWRELEQHGLYRRHAFVTNVVKCRPPENRTPKQSEVKACKPYLDAELRYLKNETKVKYILALGSVAYKALGGKDRVSDVVGVPYQYEGFTVVPCVHPAAALRSPQWMQAFVTGIASFARAVKGEGGGPGGGIKAVVVDDKETLDHLEEVIKESDYVAFDLETTGLDEAHPRGQVICLSLAGDAEPNVGYVVLWDHPARQTDKAVIKQYLERMFARNRNWVAHNGKFDRKWLRAKLGIAPQLKRDTIVMAHLLDENTPKNVEWVANRYLGTSGWKPLMKEPFREINKALESGEPIPWPPLERLVPYSATDAVVELQLAHALWPKLDKPLKKQHNFHIRVSRVLEDVEMRGLYIDRKELDKTAKEFRREVRRAVLRFAKAGGFDPQECKLGSWQWLSWALFEKLELPIVEVTASGGYATNEHVLLTIKDEAPELIQALLDYRKYSKFLGSYIEPWQELLDVNSRLRSSYNLTKSETGQGTVTGRLSATNIIRKGMSIHQVPRDSTMRQLISAPPGRKLIIADYSQLELRVAAIIAREKRMMEAYRKGEDLHKLTASVVTGKKLEDVTKEDRQRAKAVNFGFLYGMGANKFVRYAFDEYQVNFTFEEATAVREKYFRLYRGLKAWHREVEDHIRRVGSVTSPMGMVRRLPDIASTDKFLQAEAIRQGINFGVQSAAGQLTLAAMVLVHEKLDPETQWVVGTVHDSILLETDEDEAEEVARLLKHVMEKETPVWVERYFGWHIPIPIEAEVYVASKWGVPEKNILT